MNINWTRTTSNLVLVVVGVILGVVLINQYQANRRVIDLISRDATVSLVRQLHLAVSANRDLKNETASLNDSLAEIQSGRNAREVARKSIARNQLLAGMEPMEGKGIVLTISLALEPIWLVDLVNELFIRGAEKIAVNDILLTDSSSFALNNGVPYLNGNIILNTPYQFAVIGDQGALLQGLQKRGGMLDRLKEQFPKNEDKFVLESRDLVFLPAKQAD